MWRIFQDARNFEPNRDGERASNSRENFGTICSILLILKYGKAGAILCPNSTSKFYHRDLGWCSGHGSLEEPGTGHLWCRGAMAGRRESTSIKPGDTYHKTDIWGKNLHKPGLESDDYISVP